MKTQILKGKEAKDFMPIYIGDNNALVITPIFDIFFTKQPIGHLIVYKGNLFTYNDQKMVSGKAVNLPLIGSFKFVGVNGDYFHHLINNTFTGSYGKDGIFIDKIYYGFIGHNFINILKYYLL